MADKLIAFGYYGGKYSHLDWLLPLLPTQGITHYCEPFGGSAAVLINRTPSPVETYNDLDGEVVNFFKVLREQKNALLEQIAFTPFSRDEFALSLDKSSGHTNLERARRFYVALRQARYAMPDAKPSNWAYCVETSNGNMGASVSRFYNGVDGLAAVGLRLLRVQIENLPALDVIGRYDREDTLFYVDPPYTHDSRVDKGVYRHEMDSQQHTDLLKALKNCLGKVALSGYANTMYADTLPGWHVTRAPEKSAFSSEGRSTRQEVLWTNYDPAAIHSVSDLPLFAARPA
jgi:DNA adenine methylase